jgi:SAM-dependent methyltransferase
MKLNDLPPGALPARQAPDANAAWMALHTAACAPYRQAGRWAWHWARGKLGRDPVFRGMLERGDLPAGARVVDIGCGQGLVASLLQACADLQQQGAWPAGHDGTWPVRASASAYTGIELMAKDAARADTALRQLPLQPQFVCGDMCNTPLPACDVVVILDVLHYVDHRAQEGVLGRVRDALLQGASSTGRPGRLLLRVGDAHNTRGFAISQWVDHVVTVARGHRVAPTWGRPLAEWVALLQGQGYTVRSVPQSQGTPFANVLLVADLQMPLQARA